MILGPDRTKLSKRHGATSIVEFMERGYLPQAMVNFLALLGWSLDDRTEILSREELMKYFSLERVGKTPAIFNYDKFNWMNGVYMRGLSEQEFGEMAIPFLKRELPSEALSALSLDYVCQIAPLVQERAKTLGELPQFTDFFFVDELTYDANLLLGKAVKQEMAMRALEMGWERLQSLEAFDANSLEDVLRPLAAELGLKTGELFSLLRVATTGRTAAPPLFQTMAVLGKDRCLFRIQRALQKLRQL